MNRSVFGPHRQLSQRLLMRRSREGRLTLDPNAVRVILRLKATSVPVVPAVLDLARAHDDGSDEVGEHVVVGRCRDQEARGSARRLQGASNETTRDEPRSPFAVEKK